MIRAGLLLTLGSCVSYEAQPLESKERRARWHERSAESALELIDRLKREGAPGPPERYDAADGLTLEEGRLFAWLYHPGLRLARLQEERARKSAEVAGLWIDPRFSLGLLRIAESVDDRWIVNPGLSFTLPLSGRLRSERALAGAELEAASLAVLEAEREVWRDVRIEWLRWSAAEQRSEVLAAFVERATALNEKTSDLVGMGEMRPTEAALFQLETIQRQNQLHRERGEAAAADQRLRTLLGLSPDAPVKLIPTLRADRSVVAAIGDGHPTLARLRSHYDAAEARLQREIQKQVPDLRLGPQFESEEGQSRFGIQGGLPVPLFNRNRRGIAEATVDRELARASYENAYQELVGRRAVAEARAAALAEQRSTLEEVLVPLVDQNRERALRLLELGEGGALVALESQKRALETQLEWIDVQAQEAAVHAELEVLSGAPVLPFPDATRRASSEDPL